MPELKSLYQPSTLAEAQALLLEYGDRARPLAGGTSLVLSKSSKVEVLVDLSRTGLDQIQLEDTGLHLGAMVSCSELYRFLTQGDQWSGQGCALADAAGSIGTRILQNHVTVGGNCVMVYAWSDLPVALLALGASFVIHGGGERRTVDAGTLFTAHPTRSLGEGELLVEVVVPRPRAGQGSAHLKLGRNAADQALASVSADVVLDDGVVQSARVVAGAVRGLPQLLAETSDSLTGNNPDPQCLSLAGVTAGREAKVSNDYKASAEYRSQLISVLAEDAIELAVSRAQEQKS